MRLHVLSDLHIGAHEELPLADTDADVLVLAGDIAPGTRGIDWVNERIDGRPVLYVAGNHEFYGHTLPDLIDELRHSGGSAVHVLENDELVLGGVRFLGCTLWSDFDFDGRERREESMRFCEHVVNDYEQITFGREQRRLAARDTLTAHLESRRWLGDRLAEPFDGATVVVTHHAPLIRTQPPLPELRMLAGAFASDVTELMGADRVVLWIFGHTHRTADVDERGTRVISNPRGYAHQLVPGFDPAYVVDIEAGSG